MTEPISSARYFPWDGGAIFVGTAGVLPAHAHQAIQICFLFDGRIRLRPTDEAAWTSYDLGVVPSRLSHAMDGGNVHYGATLFVEPETREGRILTEQFSGNAIANVDRGPVDDIVRELRAATLEPRDGTHVVPLARRFLQALTRDAEPVAASDERILRAVRYVNDHLAAPISLAEVAAVAHLSPSRFRHLFAAQTGMALRPYILWRRFVSVWEQRMNGASLSAAAHAAGFADSAHLARTSRRMIGIPPSLLDVGRSSGPPVATSEAPSEVLPRKRAAK
jgi:AraC family transcriptional regulator